MTIPAFPLHWPQGWPRTPHYKRETGSFKADNWRVIQDLQREIRLLGGGHIVITSNVAVRQDGLPYADSLRRKIDDPGLAAYFLRKGKQMVFACDRYDSPIKNARAIALTIAAIRGIERWGATSMLERSLSAFEALPPPDDWRKTLGYRPGEPVAGPAQIAQRYRDLAQKAHPDLGGSNDAMARLTAARDAALKDIGAQ
jgi:hypothetical protein